MRSRAPNVVAAVSVAKAAVASAASVVKVAQYPHIVGWETIPAWPHPTQFIPGGNSPYVTDAYRDALLAQFPQARAHVIAGAGHWVHAEKPEAVLRAIRRYLTSIAA